MSILTRDEILREIRQENIRIDPFDQNMVGPASVDLHVSNVFRVFKKVHDVVEVSLQSYRELYQKVTNKVEVKDRLLLMPGETVLGLTREKISLAPNICGWLEGRSTFARIGLLVHISASFMQPGIGNKQVLEMSNFSPMPLAVCPGTPICQFIFQRTVGEARYEGQFRVQDEESF